MMTILSAGFSSVEKNKTGKAGIIIKLNFVKKIKINKGSWENSENIVDFLHDLEIS